MGWFTESDESRERALRSSWANAWVRALLVAVVGALLGVLIALLRDRAPLGDALMGFALGLTGVIMHRLALLMRSRG